MKNNLHSALLYVIQLVTALFIGKNFYKFLLSSFLMLCSVGVFGQVSYSTIGSTYLQSFDKLSSTATPSTDIAGGNFNNVDTSLNGWYFLESGSAANIKYTSTDGAASLGDTYSFGTTGERALGGLQSNSLNSTFGFYLKNTTGSIISSLEISYTGEQWKLGATGRVDRLDFQFSTNATSLSTGTWNDVDNLDFAAPIQWNPWKIRWKPCRK